MFIPWASTCGVQLYDTQVIRDRIRYYYVSKPSALVTAA